jgi:hypothetical protein
MAIATPSTHQWAGTVRRPAICTRALRIVGLHEQRRRSHRHRLFDQIAEGDGEAQLLFGRPPFEFTLAILEFDRMKTLNP